MEIVIYQGGTIARSACAGTVLPVVLSPRKLKLSKARDCVRQA